MLSDTMVTVVIIIVIIIIIIILIHQFLYFKFWYQRH